MKKLFGIMLLLFAAVAVGAGAQKPPLPKPPHACPKGMCSKHSPKAAGCQCNDLFCPGPCLGKYLRTH